MIVVYIALATVLCTLHFFVRRRQKKAEIHYHEHEVRHSDLVNNGPKIPSHNSPEHVSRMALVLHSTLERDAAKERHAKWDGRHKTLAKVRDTLRAWRGRKAPYVLGFLDATSAVAAIDYFGLHGQVGDAIVTFAKTLFTTAG